MKTSRQLLELYSNGLQTHVFDTDNPPTCPKCGARTDFLNLVTDSLETGEQIHQCLNSGCGYVFVAELDEYQAFCDAVDAGLGDVYGISIDDSADDKRLRAFYDEHADPSEVVDFIGHKYGLKAL